MSPTQALTLYKELNQDLDRKVVMAMAPFALAHKVGRKNVERMFSGINPTTPFRHRAWYYWNSLLLSGLQKHWAGHEMNHGKTNLQQWFRNIAVATDHDQQEVLLRRLFRPSLNYWPATDPMGRRSTYWTKGGNWPVSWGMSKILVLREHLERPQQWWSVDPERMRLFERELMSLVDPDKVLQPEAYFRTLNYAQQRYPQIRGVKRNFSRYQLPWLFQQEVQWEGKPTFIQRDPKSHYNSRRKGGYRRPKSYMIEW